MKGSAVSGFHCVTRHRFRFSMAGWRGPAGHRPINGRLAWIGRSCRPVADDGDPSVWPAGADRPDDRPVPMGRDVLSKK